MWFYFSGAVHLLGVRFDVYSPARKTLHHQQKNNLKHTEMNKNLELPEWFKSYQFPDSFSFSFRWLYLCCTYLNAAAEIHTNILGFIDALTFALTFASNKSHKTMLFFRGAKR